MPNKTDLMCQRHDFARFQTALRVFRDQEKCLKPSEAPLAHGAPVHIGDPAKIGIKDFCRPEYGDPPVTDEGDVFCFWACGVTPQQAIQQAKLDLAITHEPGFMLVTDLAADPTEAPREQTPRI